ncbi:ATP-binding cassette domain-containing protein [Massilibacterium senegalense]|uniref:ATP-binding cassette domain-containing protein n=1 Tax=Massilibacterium senegalense TaxID=1632858 RepID=UPI0007813DDA|nr:ATP-binding cassette domain-containing protein [Massilibacterium senegalense]
MAKHSFIDALTSEGYQSRIHDVMKEVQTMHYVTGSYGLFPYQLIKEIQWDENEEVEYFHSFYYPEKVIGFLHPRKKKALLFHRPLWKYPVAKEVIFSLEKCIERNKLPKNVTEMINLKYQHEKVCCTYLKKAKEIHFQKEHIYRTSLDFQKADSLADSLIKEVFLEKVEATNQEVKQRFFGTFTAKGPINFLDSITKTVKQRYIIHGRSGSGKSTLMKKIVQAARDRKESVTIYPCSFDPKSLDMVVLEDRLIAFIDGTSPHPLSKSREGDVIVDTFECCMDASVEKEYQADIDNVTNEYKKMIALARHQLELAVELQRKIDESYEQALIEYRYENVKNMLNLSFING